MLPPGCKTRFTRFIWTGKSSPAMWAVRPRLRSLQTRSSGVYSGCMAVEALIAVEDYLNTTYSPDKEYRDGVLVERNVGEKAHGLLQAALAGYLRNRRRQWKIQVYTELRIKVRENWYPIPDVCVYSLPDFEERYPTRPP